MRLSSPFRLLPMTMLAILCLLALKLGDTIRKGEALIVSDVQAEEKTDDDAEKPAETAETAAPTDEPTEQFVGQEEEEEEPVYDPSKPFAAPKKAHKKVSLTGNQLGGLRPGDRRFSENELNTLQQLSKRREAIAAREKKLLVSENLLTLTEQRVTKKLASMKELKSALKGMLVSYREQEETKIQGLVKIYETMKPKDAAAIFDEMEMSIVLLVVDRMKEAKAALILGKMNVKKAKHLTVELAEQRKLQDEKLRKIKQREREAAGPPAL